MINFFSLFYNILLWDFINAVNNLIIISHLQLFISEMPPWNSSSILWLFETLSIEGASKWFCLTKIVEFRKKHCVLDLNLMGIKMKISLSSFFSLLLFLPFYSQCLLFTLAWTRIKIGPLRKKLNSVTSIL